MTSKNIKKFLIFIAVILLFIGLASATTVNKSTTSKDKKIVKDTPKSFNTEKVVNNNKNIKDIDKITKRNSSKSIDKKTCQTKTKPTSYKGLYYNEATGEYYDDDYYYGYHDENDDDTYYTISMTNKVKLNILTSSNPRTDGKLKITVKALNGTKKINVGKIKVKFNSKEITNKRVNNGKITLNYKLPLKSGTYKITAVYTKNDKKLATKTKNIKVKDSEKMTLAINSNAMGGTFHTLTVKVTKASGKVNNGTVRVKLNGKIIRNINIKNGIAKTTFRIPNIAGIYTITVQYLKYNKIIQSITKNINVKYNQYPIFTKTITFNYNSPYTKNMRIGYGDCLQSYIEPWDGQYGEGVYAFLYYHSNKNDKPFPCTYRLLKATFYQKNYYTNKIITENVKPGYYYKSTQYYIAKTKLREDYLPSKVLVYYRKMTPSEKNYLMKYA